MSPIEKFIEAIKEKYGDSLEEIGVSQVESFIFHPEELEWIVNDPMILAEPRIVTTFPAVIDGKRRFVYVVCDENYRILGISETDYSQEA